jgi:YVTN family beta-propeller protein
MTAGVRRTWGLKFLVPLIGLSVLLSTGLGAAVGSSDGSQIHTDSTLFLSIGNISLPAGGSPEGLAVDTLNGEVFVADTGTNNVTVINASTQTVSAEISMPFGFDPVYAVFDSVNGDIYVGGLLSSIEVINGSTNRLTGYIGVLRAGFILGLAVDPQTGLIYDVCGCGFGVVEYGIANDTFAGWFLRSLGPSSVVVSPTGSTLFVTGMTGGNVSAIDAATNAVVSTAPAGAGPVASTVDTLNGDLYVADYWGQNLTVLGTTPLTDLATVNLGLSVGLAAPFSMSFDPVNGCLYVTNQGTGSQNVIVVNSQGNVVIGTIPVGQHAFGIAYDPVSGDVYVASPVSDNVSYFQPSSVPSPSSGSSLGGLNPLLLYGAILAAAVVIIAVIGVFFWRRRSSQPPGPSPSTSNKPPVS